MSWSDHLTGRNVIYVDLTRFFEHKFVGRVYADEAHHSYEIDFLKKSFEVFLKKIIRDKMDLDSIKTIVVTIESERAPKYESCVPFLDFIQSRFPNKKLVCSHHDWQEVDTKYKKIPSLEYLDAAISGCGTQITEDPLDYKKEEYTISNDTHRDKLFICTHKTRRIHKDKQIRFIRDNDLEDKGLISISWERKYLEDNLEGSVLSEIEITDKKSNPMKAFYGMVYCDISCESLHGHDSYSGIGHFQSEKIFKPFIYGVIPMITTWKDSDKPLRILGLDLFDDVIDTSFWGEENLEKKFEIIKNNIFTIERDCIENNKFKDDIWKRILKNHNTILNPISMGKFVYHYAGEEIWM